MDTYGYLSGYARLRSCFYGYISGYDLNSDTLKITREILFLIAVLDEFKGAWRSLGTLAAERLTALLHAGTIESIGSSTRIGRSATVAFRSLAVGQHTG
ncbi:MAG: hypothetical protein AB2541_04810 [Candidatus Thiodiazotropha sp.]